MSHGPGPIILPLELGMFPVVLLAGAFPEVVIFLADMMNSW